MRGDRLPKYRRQKSRSGPDRAFVVLNGHRHYLGDWNSRDSREQYRRLVNEWLASSRQEPVDPDLVTVVELIARYHSYATQYYRRPDGESTSEAVNLTLALRPLRELYGRTPAAEFGPLQLKAVREAMVQRGWSRRHCNKQVSRVRRMFRWACENALIPPATYHGLLAVTGLKRGRSEAREVEPVKPIAEAIVDATLPHLTPTVRAMVELQRVTGMRPAEVCLMRAGDIDMSGAIWVYKPYRHKTDYLGHAREVYIGPAGQKILEPWLQRDLQAYLFSPAQSERERRAAQHAARKTPLSCGNVPGSNRARKRQRDLAAYYDTQAYGRAIAYACDAAWPLPDELQRREGERPKAWRRRLGDRWVEVRAWRREHRWSPNRLRHNFATKIRKQYGLEAAQVLLGHARADVTQVYAETNRERGLQLAAKIG